MKSLRTFAVSLAACGLLLAACVALPHVAFAQDLVVDAPVIELAPQTEDSQDAAAAVVEEEPAEQEVLQPQPQEPQLFDVTYVDEQCEQRVAEGLPAIDQTSTELKAGWYVVRESVELSEPLLVDGDVRIVIQDDCALVANEGIRIKKDATLTLYGQQGSRGALLVRKGIVRKLTRKQQAQEKKRIARALEADPNHQEKEPQILFVWPCLDVTAGDHEPWPAEASTPDPDPEHAPQHVDKPVLDEDLLGKDYLVIFPLSQHVMQEDGGALVVEDGHYTCAACDGWFQDAAGRQSVQKPQTETEDASGKDEAAIQVEVSNPQTVTITFDANGGSGEMSSMEVTAGESFELPECTFAAPEGQEFNMWSLGKPGDMASVPTSTTVKAWWKDASSISSDDTSVATTEIGDDSSKEDEADGTSDASEDDATDDADASGDEDSKQTSAPERLERSSESTGAGSSPDTGDAAASAGEVAAVLMVAGMTLLLGARLRRG